MVMVRKKVASFKALTLRGSVSVNRSIITSITILPDIHCIYRTPLPCHRRVPLIYIDGVCEKNGNTGNGLGKSLKANLAGAGIEDAGYRQIF